MRTATLLSLTVGVLAMVCPLDAPASTCETPPVTWLDALAQADIVFSARASVKRNDRGSRLEIVLTRNKVWKGDLPERVLAAPADGCGFSNFEDGKDYLIYGAMSQSEGARLSVYAYRRTKLLESARIEIRYLDAAGSTERDAIDAELPELVLHADDPNTRAEAVTLLGEIKYMDSSQVPTGTWEVLQQAAWEPSPLVSMAALNALSMSHVDRLESSNETWIAALKHGSREERTAGVAAFNVISAHDSRVFRALVDALQITRRDPDPDERRQDHLLAAYAPAITAAAANAAEEQEAGELLRRLIDEIKDPSSRLIPIRYLPAVRQDAPRLLAILRSSDSEQLQRYAILKLGGLGPEMQVQVEPYLKHKNCLVAMTVIHAVWVMNREAFPEFFRRKGRAEMRSRFKTCSAEVIFVLQRIVYDTPEIEPLAADLFAEVPGGDWRKSALKSLRDYWRRAKPK